MSSTALSPDHPVSSGEIQAIDIGRVEEIERKHALLVEYLRLNNFDALLIQHPANYAWLTAGGTNLREAGGEPIAAILVTAEARVVLCNNVDSGQIFDLDLMGLGFLLKERPWTEDRLVLLNDVCRGRRTACDIEFPETINVSKNLQPFRMHLAEEELKRLRELGMEVSHSLEATGRNFFPGASEAEIAGHLAHRLMKNKIQPVQIQVMADGQGWRYRHWGYGEDRVERHCVISVIGRRHGLHVGASRTVCMGAPSTELERVHEIATLVQSTGIYFSRPGWEFDETWRRVARIYEKFGVPDEWRSAEQAQLMGYQSNERNLVPGFGLKLERGHIVHWHPSVRSSKVGDSFLITETGIENLTPVENWPVISVSVKGSKVDRPGILIRKDSTQ
ncbi:M24 family metallopeptidase [Thalassoglobus sp.]|uniref:M24 family metallopeptidase n=1 Tax=Thalassoglobus sp. TaxID=2795869 RepID=UPI003AA9E162